MTTLVVVAVDDFALRIEDDGPDTPGWLLHCALLLQEKTRAERPALERAIQDALVYGSGTYCLRDQ